MTKKRTVGERLAEYVGDGTGKAMSIRSFAKAMRLRTPRPKGSTRAMVHRYLAGATPPSDFTEAAAETLGLNPEWLAYEIGHPTKAHAEAAAVSSGTAPQAVDWQRERAGRLMHEILVGLDRAQPDEGDAPFWRSAEFYAPHWVAPLGEVRLRLVLGGSYAEHEAIEHDIAAALKGPLAAFRVDPAQMDRDTLGDYITLMVPVLLAIASEQRKHAVTHDGTKPRRTKGSKQAKRTPRTKRRNNK